MYLILDKFIQMQGRNCKIMWLIMAGKDTILIFGGHSFSADPLLSIVKRLLNQTKLKEQWDSG